MLFFICRNKLAKDGKNVFSRDFSKVFMSALSVQLDKVVRIGIVDFYERRKLWKYRKFCKKLVQTVFSYFSQNWSNFKQSFKKCELKLKLS